MAHHRRATIRAIARASALAIAIAVPLAPSRGVGATGSREPAAATYVRGRLEALTLPGRSPARLRLTLEVSPGWHIGAPRTGATGVPTVVTWRLPDGWVVDDVRWPEPRRLVLGRDTLAIHEGTITVDAVVRRAAAGPRGPVRATVTYGACSNRCVPGTLELTLAR